VERSASPEYSPWSPPYQPTSPAWGPAAVTDDESEDLFGSDSSSDESEGMLL